MEVKKLEKPKHNRFDNIWEIRQTGYPPEHEVDRIFKTKPRFKRTARLGKARIFDDVHHFIRTVGLYLASGRRVHLPAWKIVVPRLEGATGAIYYIVNAEPRNLVFRGTFGYYGTGPHESALVEACFERLGLFFEVRDGDYLLSFITK